MVIVRGGTELVSSGREAEAEQAGGLVLIVRRKVLKRREHCALERKRRAVQQFTGPFRHREGETTVIPEF
jgi:hypothetical protein